MFALVDWQAEPLSINLKCEPELALLLREIHPEVKPGWHMNKQHWNTVTLSEGLSDDLWQGWIVHSHERVVAGLPRAKRPQAPARPSGEGLIHAVSFFSASSPRGGAHTKALDLFEQSVRRLGPAHYSPEQVEQWARGAHHPGLPASCASTMAGSSSKTMCPLALPP